MHITVSISNTDFHQWIIQKYRHERIHVQGFPTLFFVPSFRPVMMTDQKSLVSFLIYLLPPPLVSKTQKLCREMVDQGKLMYEQLLICSLGPLSANSNNRGRDLTKDKGLNLLIPAKLTGQSPGFNRRRQSLLSAYDDLAGANKTTHQKIQSTVNTHLIPQTIVRSPSEEVENAGKKVHTSATNFNPYEGQLPLALSYLMPSPRMPNAPKTEVVW